MRKEAHWQQVQATMQQHRQDVWRDEILHVPDSWQTVTNGSTTAMRSLQLRMPNSRYTRASYTCIHDVHCLERVCTMHLKFAVSAAHAVVTVLNN